MVAGKYMAKLHRTTHSSCLQHKKKYVFPFNHTQHSGSKTCGMLLTWNHMGILVLHLHHLPCQISLYRNIDISFDNFFCQISYLIIGSFFFDIKELYMSLRYIDITLRSSIFPKIMLSSPIKCVIRNY